MLSCCYFVQAIFNLLALSSYPVLFSFVKCLLNPLVCFPVLFCSFCFIPLLLQISPLISSDLWLFPLTFVSKFLTSCISHCCIVGCNHGIDVYVLIPYTNEWCEFPSNGCLKSACHIWVPQLLKLSSANLFSWLVWLCRLLQTNSKSLHHKIMVISYVCLGKASCPMVLWIFTRDRMRFLIKK